MSDNRGPELQQLIAQAFATMTEEELVKCFYDTGRKTALAVNAFIQGFADVLAVIPSTAAAAPEDTEADDKAERVKTEIGDCRRCWCDSCDKIDTCQTTRPGLEPAEGDTRPFPCMGCFDGMRFRPKEKSPCSGYEPSEGFNNE